MKNYFFISFFILNFFWANGVFAQFQAYTYNKSEFSSCAIKSVDALKSDENSDEIEEYVQFDFSFPLKNNETYGEIDRFGERSDYRFLPDGVDAKIGYGLHFNKWVGMAATTGVEWFVSKKLVAIPVFLNFRLSPKIGEETRLLLQYGHGKSFAIGRGDLMGLYQKVTLGLENTDGIGLFVEVSHHDFAYKGTFGVPSIKLGLVIQSF